MWAYLLVVLSLLVFPSVGFCDSKDIGKEKPKIKGVLLKDEIKSDLPESIILPNVNTTYLDKDGKEVKVFSKVEHKVLDKKVENGVETYLIKTSVETPISVLSLGTDVSNGETSYNTIRGHVDTYFYYQTKNSYRYIQWYKLAGYWYRTESRYALQNAKFEAHAHGTGYNTNGAYEKDWISSSFQPTWKDTYNTNIYTDTSGPYRSWDYVYPASGWNPTEAGISVDIINGSTFQTRLKTLVAPRGV